jgi:outer membrane protein assembly factor BamB
MKLIFVILVCLTFFSTISLAQEATQWRGENRDGNYNETGLLKTWPADGPKLLWHTETLGDGYASVAVDEKRVYTAGSLAGKGNIFAFSPDGLLQWNTVYGDEFIESFPGTRSTPLVNDGKVYLMSGFGKIVCLSADKGAELWAVEVLKDSLDKSRKYDGENLKWGITENLLIDGDKLFCTAGGGENNVIALNKNSGKLIWSSKGNSEISAYCSPMLITVAGRKILVTMTQKSILGLDAETGKKLWSHEQVNQWSVHANTPLYSDGYLYCVSGYGCGGVMLKLSADGTSVEKAWKNEVLDSRMGGIVLFDGKIYGMGDKVKGLHCLDWKTGKELAFDKMNNKFGSIISADGMLYIYDETGEVSLVEPTADGFKKISGFKVPYGTAQHWAHPVIANGRLYIRHGNSMMVYGLK